MVTLPEAMGQAWGHFQAGRYAEAEKAWWEALDLDPDNADAWCLCGLACRQQGKHADAEASYREAVRLRPDFVEALNNLGNALIALGKPADAVPCYEQVLRLRPEYVQALNNLGVALRAQGDVEQAAACYEKALKLSPSYADAHNNLGDALTSQGKWAEAAACYRKALTLRPNFPEATNNLGVALVHLDRADEALACHLQALAQRPGYHEAQNNLGNAYLAKRDYDRAAAAYRETLRLKPDYAEGHYNLGLARASQGRLDDAVTAYRQALELKPEHAEARSNLGHALRAQGKAAEALARYQEVVDRKPNDPEAHLARALAWLLLGEYERGWPEYEWRWRCKEFGRLPYTQPPWDGSSLEGKTILLHAEQGLGDTLQFVRYAPLVKARGGRVLLRCPKALLQVLAGCRGVDALLPADDPLPAFDVYTPLLTLPALLKTTLATVPAEAPYLDADAALAEAWRRELASSVGVPPLGGGGAQTLGASPPPPKGGTPTGPGFKVAIAWQGNPDNRGDAYRSVPLRQFAPLAQVAGVQLVSVQKGAGSEQLRALGEAFTVLDPGERLDARGPFVDTAAVLKAVDLVIAADTAVAHLAGALGVPTWVVLSAAADWRWLLDRDDSPWYPTVRLFRQARFGAWDEVFARMAAALEQRVAEAPVGPLTVEVSAGELLDKITILQIKSERLKDEGKLKNVRAELALLTAAWERAVRPRPVVTVLTAELREVNEALWEVEDDLRDCERAGDFGPCFVELARSVYRYNERRGALKREVNELLGSRLREEKSYGRQAEEGR